MWGGGTLVMAIQYVAAALAQRMCDTLRAASASDDHRCAMVMAGWQLRQHAALHHLVSGWTTDWWTGQYQRISASC
jgi:hypothetical protein